MSIAEYVQNKSLFSTGKWKAMTICLYLFNGSLQFTSVDFEYLQSHLIYFYFDQSIKLVLKVEKDKC